MYQCEGCYKLFNSQHAVVQHMNAVDHWAPRWECQTCDDEFLSEDQYNTHMNHYGHWAPKVECEACSSRFRTVAEARTHMDARDHWRLHWCGRCQQGFQNANNLQQHLHGYAHLGGSQACPYCSKSHTTVSGVAHHVESGSCPNADREYVHKLINSADTDGYITNKLPIRHAPSNAANEAYNDVREYNCSLCHRGFGSLKAVNQHLESPAHNRLIFHCINQACGKHFSALAPLFNHLESGSCGAAKFGVVQEQALSMLTTGRVITV